MSKVHKILALITAREGSKRLPGKNTKNLGGKPLVMWTVDAALKSKYISDLMVSSDDYKLLDICKEAGCGIPFVRPAELSTDHSTSSDVVEHALNNIPDKYDWLLLLQPTSPLRTTKDIDCAIETAIENNVDSLVSVVETHSSYYMISRITEDNKLQPISDIKLHDLNNMRSQDMPKGYEINGAIYIVKTDWFLKNKIFFDDNSGFIIMNQGNSINIDTNIDWRMAQILIDS
jgi:CMP-N-acetylneuraminic acid synthetase